MPRSDQAAFQVWRLVSPKTDPRIVAYRNLFEEITADTCDELWRSATETSFVSLGSNGYFEDEKGTPLDEIGMIAVLTGQENPILLGNPLSVIRLGPAPMLANNWDVSKANSIAHLLRLATVPDVRLA